MITTESERTCPHCGTRVTTREPVFLSRTGDASTVEELLRGAAGEIRCAGCGETYDAWIPLLYDDPDVVVFVADADRESLIDEYHAFLELHRDAMPAETYQRATETNYLMVAGLGALRAIARALMDDVYIYRSVVGLGDMPNIDLTPVLEAAAAYRDAGDPREALGVLTRAAEFPTGDPQFWRELGAYAFSAGSLDLAEEAIERGLAQERTFAHLPLRMVPQQGMVSKPPDGSLLPLAWASAERHVRENSPERTRSDPDEAQAAGMLVGELERALIALAQPSFSAGFYRDIYVKRFEEWVAERDAEPLRRLFAERRARHRGSVDLDTDDDRLLRLGRTLIGTDADAIGRQAYVKASRSESLETRSEALIDMAEDIGESRPEAAKDFFETALASRRSALVARALLGLGRLALAREARDEAKSHLLSAASVGDDRSSPQALLHLAEMAHDEGNPNAEEGCLRSLVVRDYGELTAIAGMRLGAIHMDRGELDVAERLFMLGDRSMNFELKMGASYAVGLVRAERGDLDGARRLLVQVAALPFGDLAPQAQKWLEEHPA